LDSVKEWEKTLSTIQEIVTLWTRVQAKWLDLENVFMNEEIVSQLGRKALAKFETCDKSFRFLMTETSKNALVISACSRAGCYAELQAINENIDECQCYLTTFLASKRQIFPRLNFVTDKELLSVIGGKVPQCVQEQMVKVGFIIRKL
jgi:dynein heavy chain